jgi:hypothetical protein
VNEGRCGKKYVNEDFAAITISFAQNLKHVHTFFRQHMQLSSIFYGGVCCNLLANIFTKPNKKLFGKFSRFYLQVYGTLAPQVANTKMFEFSILRPEAVANYTTPWIPC